MAGAIAAVRKNGALTFTPYTSSKLASLVAAVAPPGKNGRGTTAHGQNGSRDWIDKQARDHHSARTTARPRVPGLNTHGTRCDSRANGLPLVAKSPCIAGDPRASRFGALGRN